MVSSLPTEIWTQILTAAIHVPIFFEADPLKICLPDFYHQYHWQSDYWASERTRNTLRRVCAFWNSILAPYDNRFIQFQDVCSGRIPITALPKAYRIDIGASDKQCDCRRCSLKSSPSVSAIEIQQVVEQTRTLLANTSRWNLQILMERFGSIPFCEFVFPLAPRLAIFIWLKAVDLQVNLPHSLQLFRTWVPSRDAPYQGRFDHVSMLSLHTNMSSYGLDQFDFPHLRHLAIRQATPSLGWIYPVLERWGKELITFKLRAFERKVPIPSKVWNLLPKVESMLLPYMWGMEPPIHPSLKVVRLSESPPVMELLPGVSNLSSGANTARWSLDGHDWSGPRIQLDKTWSYIFLVSPWISDSVRMHDVYLDFGYSLLDAAGIQLYDHLLFMIRTYWKRGAARSRRQCMNGRIYTCLC